MHFEWDSKKAKKNLKKHGVSFEEALTIFYDPFSATFNDPDHSISEYRYVTIGMASSGRILVVAHSERGNNLRLISARTATAHERRKHEG